MSGTGVQRVGYSEAADAAARTLQESRRKRIRFNALYSKILAAPGLPIRTAILLEAVVINAAHLGDHFLRYDTDNFKSGRAVQRSGEILLLIFQKENSSEIFTTLRKIEDDKVAYYRGARGETFDVILEVRK